MAGGRRRIRGLLPALTAALATLAAAVGADPAAAAACPIPGASDGVRRGVNRTNLAWEAEWRPVLQHMAEAGVGAVRLTLTQPLKLAAEIAAEAHRQGMQVLINLPLSLGEYYDPAAMPRPGNGTIRAVRRLSELEPGRYAETVGLFLSELDRRGGVLDVIEVGNEINWADFNGDLPVGGSAGVLDEAALAALPQGARVLAGFRTYGEVLALTRRLLEASRSGRAATLAAAGLYVPSPWVGRSGGSALSPEATGAIFEALGIPELVDAWAAHVYAPATEDDDFGEMLAALEAATRMCGRRGGGKPCVITEWGLAEPATPACDRPDGRLPRFREFERALACLDRKRDLVAAYLFAWDESPRHAVWHCGRLLEGGRLFRDPPIR